MSATEFKTHCLSIMDDIKERREEVIVTKHGRPVIRVSPVDSGEEPAYGCMRGTALVKGDIYSTGEDWNAEG